MKQIRKPFHVDTGNMSAFYETLDKAITEFNYWVSFYEHNIGKYGDHTITLSERTRKTDDIIYSTDIFIEA